MTPRLRSPLLVALAAVLIAACDDGGGADAEPRASATAPPAAAAVFTSGVASGDVTTNSAVLWARAEGSDTLTVEVAEDEEFARAVRTGSASTNPARDFTVKHNLQLLEPATRYYYRFRAGDAVSPTGTFTTPPDPSVSAPLRFVFGGDSDGTRLPDGSPRFNEFEVLDAAADEDSAFFLYFGDTIYGDVEPRATGVDGYRDKYRQNRDYAALAALLAATSTYNMWDDHEVENNFAGTTVDPELLAAGRKAFREYMPIDDAGGETSPMYRSFRWGKEVELILLDARSYRGDSAELDCTPEGGVEDPLPDAARPDAPPDIAGIREFVGLPSELPPGCLAAIDDAGATILGAEQKTFLEQRLQQTDATWKIVVTSPPVQMLLADPYDRWEGYAAERREILQFIRDNEIDNVVFLATDMHASIFGPVRIDLSDDEPVAYEAVVGAIAATPLGDDIELAAGESASGAFGALLTGVVMVDCAELESYSYGLVEVDPAAGTLTITSKDADGNVLCQTALEAAEDDFF